MVAQRGAQQGAPLLTNPELATVLNALYGIPVPAAGRTDIGAVVSFTGYVRDMSHGAPVEAMTLEHYPGMTEKQLGAIAAEAMSRWPLAREISSSSTSSKSGRPLMGTIPWTVVCARWDVTWTDRR